MADAMPVMQYSMIRFIRKYQPGWSAWHYTDGNEKTLCGNKQHAPNVLQVQLKDGRQAGDWLCGKCNQKMNFLLRAAK